MAPTGTRKLSGSALNLKILAVEEAGGWPRQRGVVGRVLTCIWAPGIASNSQVVELLAPVAGVGISDPCTEVRDQNECPSAEVILVVS